jgi:hypothetical protein
LLLLQLGEVRLQLCLGKRPLAVDLDGAGQFAALGFLLHAALGQPENLDRARH